MGIWGIEIYENDISLDVKVAFEELFNSGKSVQEITEKLLYDYKSIINDPIEAPLFWFALADTQHTLGVLLINVKEKALSCIERTRNQLNFQIIDLEERSQRKRVLDDLYVKLISPPPALIKQSSKKVYKCQWKIGDVYAYKLESDLAKEKELYGKYFLIQKIDEEIWYPGHVVPVVYVKITVDERLPSSVEEYNQLEYVQTWFTKYEERFFPIDMARPQEDIAEKSKLTYQVDEYGFLPQFRAILLNTSKKVIPPSLSYIGNFVNALPPQKEFIPHSKKNIVEVSWKQFNETFETKMIKRYCGHNLREFSIYKKAGKYGLS